MSECECVFVSVFSCSSGALTALSERLSPAFEAMGCGLRKLEDPEDSSPGKIYSTLKRPQVETKTDTVYEYVLLDFSLEGRLCVMTMCCLPATML